MTKISKQIIRLIHESSANEHAFPNGLKLEFYNMFTKLLYGGGKELVKLSTSFAKKEDRQVLIDLAQKHFGVFDFNQERAELLKDGKVNTAYKVFKKELDETLKSELEKYGLGKAPFKFIGAMDSPSKEVQEQNPEAYNNALRNFPRFDAGGIGSCARCYNAITTHYIIKSSDGKVFPLGSECVGRLHDKKAEDEAKKAELKLKKEKTDKRNSTKKDELQSILDNPEYVSKMQSIPKEKHTDYDKWDANKKAWWDEKMSGQSYYDEVLFKLKQSGTAGKLRLFKEVKKTLGIK